MNKHLRTLRIVVATLIFVVITCGFLNMSGGNALSQALLRTQFVPALVSVFTGSALAFIILMLLTLLFGRVYCSFLCPLGIFQDIIYRISKFARKRANGGKKHREVYRKPHNILRYTILALSGISFAALFTYPVALLDPYSNYGRIATHIFGTVETFITNMLSGVMPDYFFTQKYVSIGSVAFIYSLVFFFVVVVFSAARGRLYCNTICPVGSFLGLVGGISLFKPVLDKEKCVKCGLCAGSCKSNCINLETKEIDATRCVACYNWLTSCKRGGVKLVPVWFNNKHKSSYKRDIESKERRAALVAMGGFAAAVAARGLMFPKSLNAVNRNSISDNKPVMPPGAGNLTAFKEMPLTVITDAYSTECEIRNTPKSMEILSYNGDFDTSFTNKVVLESIGVSVDCVLAVWCSDLRYTFSSKDDKCVVSGTYLATIVYRDSENQYGVIQKPVDFDCSVKMNNKCERIVCHGSAQISSCSCAVTGDSRLELKTELILSGMVLSSSIHKYIGTIEKSGENNKKEKSCALTIYYCDKGENVWNIAKKYSTTIDAIMQENNMDCDVTEKPGMMLIPGV